MGSEHFGHALRRLRGDHSLRDLAQLANCGKTHISDLEHGRRNPSEAVAAALDDALEAGGYLRELAAMPSCTGGQLMTDLRAGLLDAIADGLMTKASLEEWVHTVAHYGRMIRYARTWEILPGMLTAFADLAKAVRACHSGPERKRLSQTAAKLAGLISFTLFKRGDPAAGEWSRLGLSAARAAEHPFTMAWVLAQHSYQHYYSGDASSAIQEAALAQETVDGRPCIGSAWAAPLEARAHALLGDRGKAIAALQRAERVFSHLEPEERTESAFGYSEAVMTFHAGNIWTYLHETSRAWSLQQRALELLPQSDRRDRPLVQLDRATCLLQDGDADEATAAATSALAPLSPVHRERLITFRARLLVSTRVTGSHTARQLGMLQDALKHSAQLTATHPIPQCGAERFFTPFTSRA
ncbi:helix-turn-helix transcriptional regulator [Streptomyces olivoreticuli]